MLGSYSGTSCFLCVVLLPVLSSVKHLWCLTSGSTPEGEILWSMCSQQDYLNVCVCVSDFEKLDFNRTNVFPSSRILKARCYLTNTINQFDSLKASMAHAHDR